MIPTDLAGILEERADTIEKVAAELLGDAEPASPVTVAKLTVAGEFRAIAHTLRLRDKPPDPPALNATRKTTLMRRFRIYRQDPPPGYLAAGIAAPPDQTQFEGVVFSDGTVCVRWQTAYRSHSVWASLADLEHVHGHPEYGTVWEWID